MVADPVDRHLPGSRRLAAGACLRRGARAELNAARALFEAQRFDLARERLERIAQQYPGAETWSICLVSASAWRIGRTPRWPRGPAFPRTRPKHPWRHWPQVALRWRPGVMVWRRHRSNARAAWARTSHPKLRQLLGRLHWMTGRRDEYVEYLRSLAGCENDPSETLKMLWNVDTVAYPINAMRQDLAKALAVAPEDDRVWLGLANVAIRSGQLDLASDWLDRCEGARPDDLAIWQARLRWAKAADQPQEVARAAVHLPGSSMPVARAAELRAWLAARTDDTPLQRASLEELLSLEGANTTALEGLAELAARRGDFKTVAELRGRKGKIDAIHERYRTLCNRPDLASHAGELARAAEGLGRTFDALAWWRLAARLNPKTSAEAAMARTRLESQKPAARPEGKTLAELLAIGLPIVAQRLRRRQT